MCAPATTPDGFDAQADRWREEALKAALLARTSAKRLRGQLLVHAGMSSNWARTLPPAAGATMPRAVIIMPIAAQSPSGSRPSRCDDVL
ncbi:hypothetical protein GCM10010313_03580 [Streptomyces violarus]|uniref:Uncharacterized protein n=1 Tax=Streptomyces violarus TaxID=67380 RepID=A0A7W5EZ07_9ACTN|nr:MULTISPECIES: hypothetical protein [Streptomyces]MBB3073891.1 hypothetical protein [Streptomyces violarus]WRT96627.1 hypothetical protein VJ737_02540 [Streptomyces sp. CGMCC 4.1772]GHC96779.1 hypothetical protein GCM10010313_03580 [Streptomyces violarus]